VPQPDERIVMTLDAGGTNFVFTAVRGTEEVVEPIRLPAAADDLEQSLANIVAGFRAVAEAVPGAPAAISFAFPGPADYTRGVIGDLANLPAYRGGVPLGPILEEEFGLPVFINNDGDLFVYGEAIAGFLPWLNAEMERAGSPKRFRNLLGVTLGTGFGGGIVTDGRLHLGDNSAAAEIWCLRNRLDRDTTAEEGVSIRGVRRVYAERTGIDVEDAPDPEEIFRISSGAAGGDSAAAREAFRRMGQVLGDALANAVTLVDAPIVIGGGLAGAHPLFLPAVIEEMNRAYIPAGGGSIPRMEITAFNLEDEVVREAFCSAAALQLPVPGTGRTVAYDPMKRTGVGVTRLGTSRATAIGACAYALARLDEGDGKVSQG